MNAANIPQELRDLPYWVCFRAIQTGKNKPDGTPEMTKKPCSAHDNPGVFTDSGAPMGWGASTTKPETWDTLENCLKAVETHKDYTGVGLMIVPPYVGIDIDHVYTADRKFTDETARQIVTKAWDSTYCELSLSGTGFHIIVKGEKIGKNCKASPFEMYQTNYSNGTVKGNGRYFAITGNRVGNSTEVTEQPELINQVQNYIDAHKEAEKVSVPTVRRPVNKVISDEELLKTLMAKPHFEKLFHGDTSGYEKADGESDLSSADMALFNQIARYTQDRDQIQRIAFQSELVREKWDREDYISRTIDSALVYAQTHPAVFSGLETTAKGTVRSTYMNMLHILRHDTALPIVRKNLLGGRIEALDRGTGIPWGMGQSASNEWTEDYDTGLDEYVCQKYGFDPKKYDRERALIRVASENSYHPVKEYFKSLPEWDGKERAETLFCEYLGAEDDLYTRTITRYTLSACVQRVYKPGIKWDHMPLIIGDQGCGKSTLIRRLAVNDSLYTDNLRAEMMGNQKAIEQVKSAWIVELGEMAGLRKAENEAVKAFLSSGFDKYRPPYAKQERTFARQCVIFGTTNTRDGVLKDPTGGRRFFPIVLPPKNQTDKRGWFLTPEIVDQIWAEVLHRWKDLPLEIPAEVAEIAERKQEEETFKTPEAGIVEQYLNMPVPSAEWDTFTKNERLWWWKRYLGEPVLYYSVRDGIEDLPKDGRIEETCLMEIWTVPLGKNWDSNNPHGARRVMEWLHDWISMKGTTGRKTFRAFGKQTIYKRVG